MHLSMCLNDLKKALANDGPYTWLKASEVGGVDVQGVIRANKENWFSERTTHMPLDDSPDQVIADYLCDCLAWQDLGDDSEVGHGERVTGLSLIENAIFLIGAMGSSYAAVSLVMWRERIVSEEAQECLALLLEAYGSSVGFVRDILRDFILDLFCFGPLWEDEPFGGTFAELWSFEELDSLKTVFQNGYETLDEEVSNWYIVFKEEG